jgi:hypothetical protein
MHRPVPLQKTVSLRQCPRRIIRITSGALSSALFPGNDGPHGVSPIHQHEVDQPAMLVDGPEQAEGHINRLKKTFS